MGTHTRYTEIRKCVEANGRRSIQLWMTTSFRLFPGHGAAAFLPRASLQANSPHSCHTL